MYLSSINEDFKGGQLEFLDEIVEPKIGLTISFNNLLNGLFMVFVQQTQIYSIYPVISRYYEGVPLQVVKT
jgi:hypothetical protein